MIRGWASTDFVMLLKGAFGGVFCPGRWGVTVDAYRCAKNGHTAFQTHGGVQASRSELKPGGPVNSFMFTGTHATTVYGP